MTLEDIKYVGITDEESRMLNDIRRRLKSGEKIDVEGMKVPQVRFSTPLELRKCSNNFYLHFSKQMEWARRTPHYQRFKEKYPELERQLIKIINENIGFDNYPWDELLKAYNLMADLVFCTYKTKPPICYDDITKLLL